MTWMFALLSLASAAPSDVPGNAHFDFDSAAGQSTPAYRNQDATLAKLTPGDLQNVAGHSNKGSYRFDGQKSLVTTELPSNSPGLTEGFTWEGFFLTPSTNKHDTDGAIADRFLSQFADDKGQQTRLTVGLSATKKDGPAVLTVALSGTSGKRAGKATVLPDCWHHFALVHEGKAPAGKLTLYLDYDKVVEWTLTGKSAGSSLLPPGKAPLTIGARLRTGDKVDRGFDGLLDEVRLTAKPLSPSQFLRVQDVERPVTVDYFDSIPANFDWSFAKLSPAETIPSESLSMSGMPQRFSIAGFPSERWGLQGARSKCLLALPNGSYRLLFRASSQARLILDGKPIIDARFPIKQPPLGGKIDQPRDYYAEVHLDGKPHEFAVEAIYDARPGRDLGDALVCYSPENRDEWSLLGTAKKTPASVLSWAAVNGRTRIYHRSLEPQRRQAALQRGKQFWDRRHQVAREQARRWKIQEPPASGHPIDAFLEARLSKKGIPSQELVDDKSFLRRVTLDALGRIPTIDEVQRFVDDTGADKRERLIDRLLASSEWADGWVGYWQDVFAENPCILKPTLNNSGPFRDWIHRSMRDNVPYDRFATELIMMEGAPKDGGVSGFAMASENDSPMAAKAHVVLKAFLAADLKCARCHDSPLASFAQRDLFSVAAMLGDRPITVPATSVLTVPPGGRVPAVTSSLKAGEKIEPSWPLEELGTPDVTVNDSENAHRPRARLAAIVTDPANPRFAEVLVNRLWQRYMGAGLVEPVDEWIHLDQASHPELLQYLSRQFALSGYDLKSLARLIFTSRAYQSQAVAGPLPEKPEDRLFAGPLRRRLTAEQLVDSLFGAVGKDFEAEELSFDPNGTQGFLNLGVPKRAWQFTSLANERDRPALAMPVNQSIIDVLTTFGWRETRPDPVTVREQIATPLQPLMLANGLMAHRIVRLSDTSAITEICLEDQKLDALVDRLFLTFLSRLPESDERQRIADVLAPAYASRRTGKPKPPIVKRVRPPVDWDKHLLAEATAEQLEAERFVRQGEPPTVRLTDDFRERVEDVLWCLINTPEFVFVP